MRSSNTHLRLAAAVLSACSSLAAFAPAAAPAAEKAASDSMFGEAPSISKSRGGLQKPVSITKLPDGSVSIEGPIHQGKGVNMQIVIPQIRPHVEFNGPGGVDENGNPVTLRQKRDRDRAYRMVFEGLKAQGYSYEEQKKKMEGRRTQADIWKEKTEETRKYVEKHGPITTKSFVIPGSTPELSAKLDNPEVGVRIENGKRVYYLNGERIDPYAVGESPKKKDDRSPAATITTTKVRMGKRMRTVSEENSGKDAAIPGTLPAARPSLQNPKTKQGTSESAEHEAHDERDDPLDRLERSPSIQRSAPTTPYAVDPEDDLRRSPLNVVIDPNAMPGVEDVERRVEEMFPDMGRINSQGASGNGNGERTEMPAKPAKSKTSDKHASSFFSRALGFALGIREASASEVQSGLDRNSDAWAGVGVGAPNVSPESQKEFGGIIDEIAAGAERLRARVTGEGSAASTKEGAGSGQGKENDDETDAEAPSSPSYVDSIVRDGLHFDAAAFAADVVNRTKSLTPEQFEEDVKAVTGAVSEKDSPANALNALAAILNSNPEIYAAIPDADKRLARLQGKVIDIAPPNPLGEQTFIFISYSLSDSEIKSILERQKSRKDVTLVMRGVPDGMNIPDGVQRIQNLAAEVKPPVPIIIDPALFRKYGISRVPAVVRAMRSPEPLGVTPDQTKPRRIATLVAKVAGLDNDEWLKKQIEAGERGDLGLQGNTKGIAEPDLIEEMKRRVALIDWQKKKDEAAKRFWKKKEFKVFPTASEERLREIDPTILVEKDLTDLAGRPIRKAGDRVNPLQIRLFTQTIIIFNPVSEDEMERVEALRAKLREEGRRNVVLIATQIDKKADWDGYVALTDRLDSHVYLMTPEVEYQWRIEKTPAVVTADNNRHVFLVRELGPLEPKKEGAE